MNQGIVGVPVGVRRLALALAALCALLLCTATVERASADVVGNPGAVQINFDAAQLKVGTGLPVGFGQATGLGLVANGTIAADGTFSVPRANITNATFTVQSLGPGQVTMIPVSDMTGSIDPGTGAVSVNAKFKGRVTSSAFLGQAVCTIGTDADPIVLEGPTAMTTSQTGAAFNPSGTVGAGPYAGTAYSTASGTFISASNTFTVPAVVADQTCPNPAPAGLNGLLGLPASSGQSAVALQGLVSPVIVRPGETPPVAVPSAKTSSPFGSTVKVSKSKPSFNTEVQCVSSVTSLAAKCHGNQTAKGTTKYRIHGKLVTKRVTIGVQGVAVDSPNKKQLNYLLGPTAKRLLKNGKKMSVVATTVLDNNNTSTVSLTIKQ